MKLVINNNRTVIPVGTWGTVNENNHEIIEFEFPKELDDYNKRIVYYLDDERVWDAIVDNKAYLTNEITAKEKVKAYVWLTKEDTEKETVTDFRTKIFEMRFFENQNADAIVPTEQQISEFNTMLTAMNKKIDDIKAIRNEAEEIKNTARDFGSAIIFTKAETNPIDGHLYFVNEESLGSMGFQVDSNGHLIYETV